VGFLLDEAAVLSVTIKGRSCILVLLTQPLLKLTCVPKLHILHLTYDQFRRKSLWYPYWYFSCSVYSREVSELKTRSDLYAGLSAHTYCHAPHDDITVSDGPYLLLLLLLLLLYGMDVSCHRPFFPGTSLEPAVIPTAQASSFALQYFPYYYYYYYYYY
jgi:hypothetical protein